jgi:ribosomal protein L21E
MKVEGPDIVEGAADRIIEKFQPGQRVKLWVGASLVGLPKEATINRLIKLSSPIEGYDSGVMVELELDDDCDYPMKYPCVDGFWVYPKT